MESIYVESKSVATYTLYGCSIVFFPKFYNNFSVCSVRSNYADCVDVQYSL